MENGSLSVKIGESLEVLREAGEGDARKFVRGLLTASLFFAAPGAALFRAVRREPVRESEWEWQNDGGDYAINLSESNPNIVVSGMSGSGKTMLVRNVALQIAEAGCGLVALDFHNEFSFIDRLGGKTFSPDKVAISLWSLDGKSPRERVREVSNTLSSVLGLGALQVHYLERAALLAFKKQGVSADEVRASGKKAPSMREVIDACDELAELEKKESIFTLRARLASLANEKIFSSETLFSFNDLLAQPSRVLLSHVNSDKAVAVFVESFLSKLYGFMLARGLTNREPNVFVVIDEGHRIKGQKLVSAIARECRKFSIALVVSSQSLLDLDAAIPANCSSVLCFYAHEPKQVEYAVELLSHGDRRLQAEIANKLSGLQPLECMVVSSTSRLPTVVKTPLFEEPTPREAKPVEKERKRYSNQFLAFTHLTHLLPSRQINYEDNTLIPPYSCDITIPSLKTAIHWNGLRYHSSKEAVARDQLKNRLLEAKGWKHFTIVDDGLDEEQVKAKTNEIAKTLRVGPIGINCVVRNLDCKKPCPCRL